MGQKYNKLVRDNIPDYLASINVPFEKRVADDAEYREALYAKLEEEVNEFFKARTAEELADVMEVVKALRHLPEYTEAKTIQRTKREDKGGFEERYIVKGEKPDEVKIPTWPHLTRVTEAKNTALETVRKYKTKFRLPMFFSFTIKRVIGAVLLAILIVGSLAERFRETYDVVCYTFPCDASRKEPLIKALVGYIQDRPEMVLLTLVIAYLFMCFIFRNKKQYV